MPSYLFACKSCSHQFEKVSKIADRDIPVSEPCPECGKIEVTREFTPTPMSYGINGVGSLRVPQGFREVLQKVKAANPYHKIDGEYSH
jgi:putative FmdB family regulatory protein